jgi:hypothetical protein
VGRDAALVRHLRIRAAFAQHLRDAAEATAAKAARVSGGAKAARASVGPSRSASVLV